ncbi:hypothetical protein ACJMK2_019701, partial [Sinanodonta woodiana]
MDSLVYLYLENNEIVNVTLCGLDSLVYLYLQNNAIVNVNLDSTTSSCSPALRELYLRNNTIEMIEAEYTNRSQLRNLVYMDIGINQLQHIPEALKRSDVLPAIITLLLDNNRLTFLESGTFFNLSTLLLLNLGFNSIVVIEKESFPIHLRDLNLQNNNFRFRHGHPFAYLSSLVTLNLAVNNIDVLPHSAFSHCYSLVN